MKSVSTFDELSKEYSALVDAVKQRMGEHRFAHTLAVAKETVALAGEYSLSPKDQKKLFVAALLHDVTKALDFDRQMKLAQNLEIPLTEEDIASPPILHSLTGAAVAKRDFAPFADDTVCEAIRCHTVGKADMTLLDKLLFLADYIEETRSHPICQNTRKEFYKSLAAGQDKKETLDRFIVLIAQNTLQHVESQGRTVHTNTRKTIESLSKKG